MQGNMMAALAYKGEQHFRVEEVPIPEIDDGEVLVKVEAAGVNRGNLSAWKGGNPGVRFSPTVLGNEISGVIAEVGRGVRSFKEGERVSVHSILTCRDCSYCRTDLQQFCPSVAIIGLIVGGEEGMPLYQRYHNGGLAQYVRAPAWALDPLPEEIPFDVGARVHNLAVAFRTIKRAGPPREGTLVVNGATGATGASAIKCAPLFGITKVIAVSRTRETLEKVKALEPGLVEGVATEDLPAGWEEKGLLTEKIRTMTGGRGADAVVDFMPTGGTVTLQTILGMRKCGTAVLAAMNPSELNFLYGRIVFSGYEIKGSYGFVRRDKGELMEILRAGKLEVSDLVTHKFPLEEVNTAAETVENRTGAPRWVMVNPHSFARVPAGNRSQL